MINLKIVSALLLTAASLGAMQDIPCANKNNSVIGKVFANPKSWQDLLDYYGSSTTWTLMVETLHSIEESALAFEAKGAVAATSIFRDQLLYLNNAQMCAPNSLWNSQNQNWFPMVLTFLTWRRSQNVIWMQEDNCFSSCVKWWGF